MRVGLEEAIRREETCLKRDPDKKIEVWQERIALADRKRRRYQEMAAEGLINLDELRESLAELAEEKATAENEIESLIKRDMLKRCGLENS